MPQPALADTRGSRLADDLTKLAGEPALVVGMDHRADIHADHRLGVIAEDLEDRRRLVADDALSRNDADDVGRTLDQRLEAPRALAFHGGMLHVHARDGQGDLSGQGAHSRRQLVVDGSGRLDHDHAPGPAGDGDASDQDFARREYRRAVRPAFRVGSRNAEQALIGQLLPDRGELTDFEDGRRQFVGMAPNGAQDFEWW